MFRIESRTRAFHLFPLLLLLGLLSACATNPEIKVIESPFFGFTEEVDEPSARGQLVRISPEDLEIDGRFSLSTDEQWIVCSARPVGSKQNEPYQLYKFSTAGGGAAVKLTVGGDSDCTYPSFSVGDNYIYYNTKGSFWKINANGSGARMKIPGSGIGFDCCSHIGPNQRLVFNSLDFDAVKGTATRGNAGRAVLTVKSLIWTVDPLGRELTQYREGSTPVWAPDGSLIAFEYKGDIWMISSDGGSLTQITTTPDVFEALPWFSPDGNSLAFASDETDVGEPGKDINIWTIGLNASKKTQVTELESWDSWPVWSTDGIFFLSGRGGKDKKVQRIWKLRMSAGN